MLTNHFLNTVAGKVFDVDGSAPLPTAFYIGISSTLPNVAGEDVTEPVGNGYERIEATNLGLKDDEVGTVTNTTTLSFPESTGAWGTFGYYVIYDAPTGGNLLMFGQLQSPRTIDSENIMIIKPNTLTLVAANN